MRCVRKRFGGFRIRGYRLPYYDECSYSDDSRKQTFEEDQTCQIGVGFVKVMRR